MAYGILKCDTVTFTNAGVDKSVSISGLVQNPTFSGNVTVTGTLSGVTVTGTTASFTSGNFTSISGGTHTITSGVFAAGSAASPSITFTGDLNTGIYSPGADQVAISTGGSGRLFVDAAGRVGIGTTSPAGKCVVCVSNNTGAPIAWNSNFLVVSTGDTSTSSGIGFSVDTSDSSASISALTPGTSWLKQYYRANSHTFWYGNAGVTQGMTLDSSGRLLVGTSTGRNVADTIQSTLQVEGTSYNAISVVNNTNDIGSPALKFGKSRGTTNGSNTVVQNGDYLGAINFAGANGTNLENIAGSIACIVDATPGVNDMPGRLVFSTTADGASSPTERMRITSAGKILYNTTTAADNTAITIRAYDNSVGGAAVELNGWGNGRGHALNCVAYNTANADVVYFNTSAATVGSISITSTATAYNTSSDYRLKENIVPVIDGIIRLKQLKPSRFNFLTDPSKVVDGFVAHEVQSVVPEAVTGTKDEIGPEGTPKYQGIDQSKLVPLLTAALQEAIGEIESLKARVAALESA